MNETIFWIACGLAGFFAPAIVAFCLRSTDRWQILQLNFAAFVLPYLWFVAAFATYGGQNGVGD